MLHKASRDDDGHTNVRDLMNSLLDGEEVGIDDEVARFRGVGPTSPTARWPISPSISRISKNDIEPVLKEYVDQCAITMSSRQLARAGRYLMVERADSDDEKALRRARRVRRVNALMLTCGQYDGSGEFAYRVGLPAKERRRRRHPGGWCRTSPRSASGRRASMKTATRCSAQRRWHGCRRRWTGRFSARSATERSTGLARLGPPGKLARQRPMSRPWTSSNRIRSFPACRDPCRARD